MISTLNQLDAKLGDLYKRSPTMPESGRKSLVEYLPWASLAAGVLSLFLAWGIWHAAAAIDTLVNYTNALSAYYGVPSMASSGWTVWLWLALLAVAIEGVLYFAAFPSLRARKKLGWDLLFYGMLVNVAYALASLFAYPNDGFMRLVGLALTSAIGFYFLYQVRSYYTAIKATKMSAKK